MDLDILAAEALGRTIIRDGSLPTYRGKFTLSKTRLASILATSTQIISKWENNPSMADTMHSMSAAKIGQFAHQLDTEESRLAMEDVQPQDLIPLANLAARMGLSPRSERVTQKCQTGELTCYNLPLLGTYVPRQQASVLKGE